MNNRPATPEDMKELFGEGFHDAQAEAEERWGDSDAWKESQRRTKGYSKQDWEAIKVEQDAIHQAFVAAIDAGGPPTSEAAMDAAEATCTSATRVSPRRTTSTGRAWRST